ncbi:diacylglycerol kinase family lipid kinase [Rhabdobacter roseus]
MIRYIEDVAQQAGHHARVVTTQGPGHATELVQEALPTEPWAGVVAVGGDGTVNEVARALVHTPTPLGILPLGSGNGLARHLGLPLTLKASLQRVLAGSVSTIDSARLNEYPFFGLAGMGFDAHVGQLFSQQAQRGLATYVKVAMEAYWPYQPQTYVVNGKPQPAFSLSFANAGQFGNNAWVAPQADLSDGLLDVCTVAPFPKLYGTALSYLLFTRQMPLSTYVSYQKVQEIWVETEQPPLIHYDGEPVQLATTRVDVRIVPQSLRVIS